MFFRRLLLLSFFVLPALFVNAQSDLQILDEKNSAVSGDKMPAPDDFVYVVKLDDYIFKENSLRFFLF